jgi:hypothetical protein
VSTFPRIAAVLPLAAAMFCQEYTAGISITVSDPSGAVVPGARVVLVDTRRGTVRQADTDQLGSITLDGLQPSDYSLEISKEGFEKSRVDRISLGIRDRQSLRAELKISAAGSSVTVSDTVQGVSTDASNGISVDQDYIQNLPVNGRNAESLVMMAPGITSAAGGRGGMGGFNANGLRSNQNYYTLDGLSLNNALGGGGPVARGGRGL